MIPLMRQLFAPDDLVELRLIETWVEAGKKRSRFVESVFDFAASFDEAALRVVNAYCAGTRANAFVGVCPRSSREPGRSRTIPRCRCLWADLDHCRPPEAVERIERATLPPASLLVGSGNGSHAYWLIDEPLTFPASATASLSPEAERVEAVVRGLSARIGGDHTSDLARLLRLPGTLNRKDARNGRPPTPCEVYEQTVRRYPFATFEPLAAAPAAKPRKASRPGAAGVRRRGGTAWDGLTERQRRVTEQLLDGCARAGVGGRSEADYALCSWAVKLGLDPDELWDRVADVGKFGERGEAYFTRTWQKAEAAVGLERERLAELYGI